MHHFLLLFPLLSAVLFADLTIISQSDEQSEVTYYKAGKMLTIAEGSKTILNTKDKTITIILEAQKIYLQESLKDYIKSLGGSEEERKEQMKLAQETEKEPALPLIKKTGTANVAGYNCDTYEITDVTSRTIEEECFSKEVEALIGKEIDLDVMKELSNEMDSFAEESRSQGLDDKGYSLRTVDLTYGNSGITTAVTSISTEPIKASLFVIPKTFKKVGIETLYSSMIPQ